MAKLRKWVAYRTLERPFTRISKYRSKSYVKSRPGIKIVRFDMGNLKGDFDYEVSLVSKANFQVRQESIEAARQTTNKLLEKKIGSSAYHFKIRKFPHHILRENPLASGAGADRLSTGMARPFGKIIGVAAQVKKGDVIMTIRVKKENLPVALASFKRAISKLPMSYYIVPQKIVAN